MNLALFRTAPRLPAFVTLFQAPATLYLNGAVWDMRKMGKTAEVNTLVLLLIKMFEEEGFEAFQIAQDLGIDKDLFTENGVFMPPLIED